MPLWLFKEEPAHYSFADLQRDGSAFWDGVENALAQKLLRAVRPGDRVFFYHTGKEKAVVGEMRVVGDPRPVAEGSAFFGVDVEPVGPLARAVPLSRIKQDALLAGWDLAR